MIVARAAFLALLALAGSPTRAQSNAEKARLDDLATKVAAPSVAVEQVPDSQRVAADAEPAAPVVQLSVTGERSPSEQIGKGQERTVASVPALSARSEGRPQPTVALGGTDRCDPRQGASARSASCSRIIERRAAEFQAPRAPIVSAEAALLALDQKQFSLAENQRGPHKPGVAADPDDLQSQELAAVMVAAPPTAQDPEPNKATSDQAVIDAVSELIVQMQNGTR